MKKILIAALLFIGIISCNRVSSSEGPGNFDFDKEDLTFSADSSSMTIYTEQTWWSLYEVTIGEKSLFIIYNYDSDIPEEYIQLEKHYLDSIGASVSPELLYRTDDEKIDVTFQWLKVSKIDNKQLRISVSRNDSGSERKADVYLESGDTWCIIKITQQ